jgi:nucleotide-binding universal stress UspA family protein
MFARLLVPLDGSDLAEKALAYAEFIAHEVSSAIHLLRVVSLPTSLHTDIEFAVLADTAPTIAEETSIAESYLAGCAARVAAEGIQVTWSTTCGDAASEIVSFAKEHGIDLIVMSTHGRSGVGRWVYGSVADRVLRGAAQPVLLVRAASPVPGDSLRSDAMLSRTP